MNLIQKLLIFSFLSCLICIPFLSNSYALTDSICSSFGLNANQTSSCVKAYINYHKMNQDTAKSMQQYLDQNRAEIQKLQVLQDVSLYHNYTMSKPSLAQTMIWNDIYKRDWYIDYTKRATNEMLISYNNYKLDKGTPVVPIECPAWHVCLKTPISLNYTSTSIPLKKPEFNNTSGFINETNGIHNMQQYQAYLNANKTK